ncbi:MAG: M1 family aminopeptidase [Gemmatimonadaceae bacterium]
MALLTLFGLFLALPASDSLMTRGVSQQLARDRAVHISAVRYDLTLDVTRRDTAIGAVRATFTRKNGGDVILDFRGQDLKVTTVNGVVVRGIEWNGAHVRVPARALRDGQNTIAASFKTPIAPAGTSIIRFTDETDRRDYLYTLLVPSDAHLLFPCFDQPDIKAVFGLRLTVPVGWRALSNGAALPNARADGRQQTVFQFAPTKRISTYLFAFAAGPYARLRDESGDITLWVRQSRAKEVETDTLIALNRRARDWLADYFGVPYPFGKLDFLLAPAFPFGGMEHPGAVFYNEESHIYREPPTLNQLLGRKATINHELAHQWFGDYTTMRWFDDLWLKEGFATYMASKMSAASGDSTAWMSFYLRNKPSAYDVDASAGTTPVWQELTNLDQAKSNYGAIVYNKAPGVLKQLEYLVGEHQFRLGVQSFLRRHAYGNATWRELLGLIGGEMWDLTRFGQAYFLRPGMPVVEQQLDVRDGRIQRLALVQRPAQPLSGPGAWPMRVEVLVRDANGSRVLPVVMEAETTVVARAAGLPAPEFVYANANDYGYGLFMLDDRSRDWLLDNHVSVGDPFLRAMLWGSLWDLVRDARLDPARYVNAALEALQVEPDEQIASRLLGRIGRSVENYLFTAEDAEDAEVLKRVEGLFLRGASDTAKAYGLRKSHFDNYVSVARTPEGLRRLDAWLDSASAAGMPLRQPSRWSIVTSLIAKGWAGSDARLAAETRRDTTTSGKRRTFIAGAAFPRMETKRVYFARYLRDSTLNEDWAVASLGAFNASGQAALTLPHLRPALDTLPWIQANRRIFFLGSWLGAFIGGKHSPEALAEVDRYLAEQPRLPRDLRQKVLQARDDLERTTRIRARFAR